MKGFEPIGDAIGFDSLRLKTRVSDTFRLYQVADRAYLSMIRYNNLPQAVPVLCVVLSSGISKKRFDDAMADIKHSLRDILGDVSFDLIVLDEQRERALRKVSSPFFEKAKTRQ